MKPNGLLLVDKKRGGTSHDVVDEIRRIVHLKKVGHTGTLDPQAEGLMVLCLRKATRLQQYLMGLDKTYTGTIKFGYATTTYDAEGEPSGDAVECAPTLEELNRWAKEHTGRFMQTPPPYSAKRYKGKRLYELARAGQPVPHLEKEVNVKSFTFDSVEKNLAHFTIHCGSGTYLRTIAHEMGKQAGCGAYLHYLQRLSIGPFKLEDAITLEDLEKLDDPCKGSHFIPINAVPLPFPSIKLDRVTGSKILAGRRITTYDPDYTPEEREGLVQVLSPTGRLLCVGQYTRTPKGTLVIEPKVVVGDNSE